MKKHTSIVTTVTPETPGIPRAMVYGLYRALPGDRACLPPSPAKVAFRRLDASVGASGPHDFAVRASAARLATPSRPPHPAPTFVTTRTPLSTRRDGASRKFDLPDGESEIFFARALDRNTRGLDTNISTLPD